MISGLVDLRGADKEDGKLKKNGKVSGEERRRGTRVSADNGPAGIKRIGRVYLLEQRQCPCSFMRLALAILLFA